ncbi:DMT family transporter [Actinokineospora pegani]|uniref:DMT family transporter n=1 Tax=Actinokineospora pegani TaxID=2654637 RepID=UPI0012EA7D23|nr:DMT family transporter [Actinokineospora pegani]
MLRGSAFAALAMIMVGSSVAVVGLLRDFPVHAGQALRFGLAAVLLLIVLKALRRRGGQAPPRVAAADWVRVTVLAALGMVGFNVALTEAGKHTDPALVGVIVGCAPIVITLVSPLVARGRPTGRLVLAGVVVAAGAAVAHGFGLGGSALGVLLSVCALLGEVAFALVAAPLLPRLGALRVSTCACVAAVPLCLVGVVVTGEVARPDGTEVLALLWLAGAVTACAYVCWFTAVAAIGPERAGLFTSLVPVSAVALTAVLGVGDPTLGHVLGAAFVLAGLLIGMWAAPDTRPSGSMRRGAPWAGPRRLSP